MNHTKKPLLLIILFLAGCQPEAPKDDFDRMMDVMSVEELFTDADRSYTRQNYTGALRFYKYITKQHADRRVNLTDNQRATLMFRKAMLAYLCKDYQRACDELTRFISAFPNHPQAAEARQYIGFCLMYGQIAATQQVATANAEVAGTAAYLSK